MFNLVAFISLAKIKIRGLKEISGFFTEVLLSVFLPSSDTFCAGRDSVLKNSRIIIDMTQTEIVICSVLI